MNDHTAVIDRLRRAAEHIEVAHDFDSITAAAPRLRASQDRTTGGSHRALLVAACVALIATGLAGVALSRDRSDDSSPAGATGAPWQPPSPVPSNAPPAGSVAPAVPTPPAWLTDLAPAMRDGDLRSGRWISTAIARTSANGYDDPILLSVFDGEYAALRDAETIDVDGQTYRAVQIGTWQALASDSSPTVMAEGAVELQELADAIAAAAITTNGPDFSILLATLPDGYDVIIAPQALGDDATPRRTLASQSNMLTINEVSDWIDPLLYAASTGTDITRHTVAGAPAWTGTTNERIPLTFLVWSPQPGVVFEITTTDNDRPVEDLVALAEQTTAISVADWDAAYPG